MNRTGTVLHPVKWYTEKLASGQLYGIAWGGGLAETVTTGAHDTEAEVVSELKAILRKLGRCPDPSMLFADTEHNRNLKAILAE